MFASHLTLFHNPEPQRDIKNFSSKPNRLYPVLVSHDAGCGSFVSRLETCLSTDPGAEGLVGCWLLVVIAHP